MTSRPNQVSMCFEMQRNSNGLDNGPCGTPTLSTFGKVSAKVRFPSKTTLKNQRFFHLADALSGLQICTLMCMFCLFVWREPVQTRGDDSISSQKGPWPLQDFEPRTFLYAPVLFPGSRFEGLQILTPSEASTEETT